MSLNLALHDIVSQLPAWESAGLNESQTCQATILRVLYELGYDIWNPFEIFAEKSGGIGSGKYFPDYTVILDEQERFVIEAKKLGESLNNHREQPVNYVNAKGLRWAVLTDGKNWEFLDNRKNGAASEKLAIAIIINNLYAARYLEKLLSPMLWRLSNAEEQIAHNIKLIELAEKLRKIIESFNLVKVDENVLSIVIQNRQLSDNEHDFAEKYFSDLTQLIIQPLESQAESTPASQPVQVIQKQTSQSIESKDVLEILREEILKSNTQSVQGFFCEVKIGHLEIGKLVNWRDIHVGIAETCILMGKELHKNVFNSMTEKVHSKTKEPFSSTWYRQLSNGQYLFIWLGVGGHKRYINKLLKNLDIPKGALEIKYKDAMIYLPTFSNDSSSTIDTPPVPKIQNSVSQPTESKDVLEILRDEILKSNTQSIQNLFCKVKVGNFEVEKLVNWRDIYIGAAETCISKGKELKKDVFNSMNEKINKSTGKPYSRSVYRQLSNGKYFYVHWSAQESKKHTDKLLKILDIPKGTLEVKYKNETFYLPE